MRSVICGDSRKTPSSRTSRKDVEWSEFRETANSRRRGFGWFQRVPRIRVRQPENKCQDQVLELAVLNERLAGASPWEVRRKVEYLKKRQVNWDLVYEIIVRREAAATLDLIEEANNKVELALSEDTKEKKSFIELKRDLIKLQQEVNDAHKKLHSTELRVRHNLQRIQELKTAAKTLDSSQQRQDPATKYFLMLNTQFISIMNREGVDRSLMDYWYPIAFSKDLVSEDTLLPFELFGRPWVVFQDPTGGPGCLLDECAHRACPLSIGKVTNGCVSCPYHGWEYNAKGECQKMPSTVFRKNVSIDTLPVIEHDGLIWVWPGSTLKMQDSPVPGFAEIPDGFTVVSEIETTAQLSQGLVLESLLDTHVPQLFSSWFQTSQSFFSTSSRDESMIDLAFEPPCNVLSLSTGDFNHPATNPSSIKKQKIQKRCFHQLHVCLPCSKDQVRILQRTSINFLTWMLLIPPLKKFSQQLAQQALEEDLELAKSQQERMMKYGSHKTEL